MTVVAVATAVGLAGATASLQTPPAGPASPIRVVARRLPQNPLVTPRTSPSLGDNLNGPAIIRVPPWIARPLGRYYMYFAHHMGGHIRLAFANAPEGPWRAHEPGVIPVRDTAFFRPLPDPPETLDDFYTHVASPDVWIDTAGRRLVMWVHGWWTEGQRWPASPAAARQWARERGYAQYTQAATSTDGLSFQVHPAVSKTSYLRVFQHDGVWYGMGRLGSLSRARDPLGVFEPGANPFRDGAYANRVRHVAVLTRGDTLYVFFSAIGDAPERILMSTVRLSGDWTTWLASTPAEILEPSAAYECASLPVAPSAGGDIKVAARQLRDPAIFEEGGRVFLFYSYCGEQGIAGAELTFNDAQ